MEQIDGVDHVENYIERLLETGGKFKKKTTQMQ